MITRGIAKSSKRKQKLYKKFLKNRTSEKEINFNKNRRLFESLKQMSKQFFYSNQFIQFHGNAKRRDDL